MSPEPTQPPRAPGGRPERPLRWVRVEHVERLTPRMIRIVFGGEGLADFDAGAFTDHYVKLQLPPPGAPYAAPFELEAIRAQHPRELWPRTRTYTVSDWDRERRLLTVDFVVHGDEGVAGPWAARAKPGDMLALRGPGGAYAPDPEAAWHLMVGDPSVVPAISASLARIPAGRPVRVVLQVADADDELELSSPGELEVRWLHGGGLEAAADAVRELDFPAGTVHAFIHGEASAVRFVRRHLVVERGVPEAAISASGYWKRTLTDEGWREQKAAWAREVAADAAGSESVGRRR